MVNGKTIGLGLLIGLRLVAGCSDLTVAAGNYLTYNHAFTDAAAEKARVDAGKLCAQRKQVALKTRSVCSVSRCTTDFQCVSRENPMEYQPENLMTNQY